MASKGEGGSPWATPRPRRRGNGFGNRHFGVTFKSPKYSTCQLSEVITARPQYGVSDPAVPYDPNLARYIRITDIKKNGSLDDGIKVSTRLDGNERYLLRQNDLLFARTGSVGRTFLVRDKLEKAVFASYLIRFNVDSSKIFPPYLEQYTRSGAYWSWIASMVTQSAQPNINARQFSKLQIPAPPMQAQKKIASILSNVDALADNAEALSAHHVSLKRKANQILFGITFTNLKWNTQKLSEVITAKPQYGVSDSAMPYDPDLARYIRITDIGENGNLDDEIRVSTRLDGNERYLLKQNDLLFARTGSVGKTFLVRHKLERTVFASYLIRFNVDPSKIHPPYLEQYTRSGAYWSWVTSMSTQSVQPNINARQFSKLTIPMPPMPEQRKIASILSGVDAVIENYRLYQRQLERLKMGLMQKLLSGKIRV